MDLIAFAIQALSTPIDALADPSKRVFMPFLFTSLGFALFVFIQQRGMGGKPVVLLGSLLQECDPCEGVDSDDGTA